MTQSLPDAAEQAAAAEKESALVRIIDDEIDVREALALMLRIEGWTAKTYPNARAFLIEDDVRRPGCLVLDMRMPLMTGLELQNEMLRRGLMLPTIFLTGHADIDVAVSSLKRGAVDFLIKPVNDDILLESIAAAVHCVFLRRAGVAGGEGVRERLRLLSARELDVLGYFLNGETDEQVADKLSLSERTVEGHRARIYRKFGIHTLKVVQNRHDTQVKMTF